MVSMNMVKLVKVTLCCACCMSTVFAELKPNPYSTKVADAALKIKDWSAAEAEFERIVNFVRGTPMSIAGFGAIYFKKGWCEYKQGKWNESMDSFEQCYKKFPSTQNNKNSFHNESLRWWAEAAYMAKDYEMSAALFRKYLTERSKSK